MRMSARYLRVFTSSSRCGRRRAEVGLGPREFENTIGVEREVAGSKPLSRNICQRITAVALAAWTLGSFSQSATAACRRDARLPTWGIGHAGFYKVRSHRVSAELRICVKQVAAVAMGQSGRSLRLARRDESLTRVRSLDGADCPLDRSDSLRRPNRRAARADRRAFLGDRASLRSSAQQLRR
jgi:hypothetical protein